MINQDIIEGNWKEISGYMKEKWGEFTDDDLTEIKGSSEKLAGTLQKKYGYEKERAKEEAEKFLDQACKRCKK